MSHFNKNAAQWDSPQKIKMMDTLAARTIEALHTFLPGSPVLDIIDFGCGTGLFGLRFVDYARSLTGIDTSEGMLDVFEQKTANQPHIRAINFDMEQPATHQSNTLSVKVDLILSCMAFHHLQQPDVVLARLKSLLAPKGIIAIVDLDKEDGTFHPNNEEMGVRHFGFSQDTVEQWAQTHNLSLQHKIIHTLERNNCTYPFFLAVFSLK